MVKARDLAGNAEEKKKDGKRQRSRWGTQKKKKKNGKGQRSRWKR